MLHLMNLVNWHDYVYHAKVSNSMAHHQLDLMEFKAMGTMHLHSGYNQDPSWSILQIKSSLYIYVTKNMMQSKVWMFGWTT